MVVYPWLRDFTWPAVARQASVPSWGALPVVSIRAELTAIQRQLGLTTIYVTHDQEEALAMSDWLVDQLDPGTGPRFERQVTVSIDPTRVHLIVEA
jgi:ABC-type nitrate/sulfonate/bicarbonate transport system ATPase subunit